MKSKRIVKGKTFYRVTFSEVELSVLLEGLEDYFIILEKEETGIVPSPYFCTLERVKNDLQDIPE